MIIDSEDTDVYVQACYVANHVDGELLIKHKNTYLDCKGLVTPDIAEIIIQLHAITGCDHNSGFYEHEKKSVMEKVIKSPKVENFYRDVAMIFQLQLTY